MVLIRQVGPGYLRQALPFLVCFLYQVIDPLMNMNLLNPSVGCTHPRPRHSHLNAIMIALEFPSY